MLAQRSRIVVLLAFLACASEDPQGSPAPHAIVGTWRVLRHAPAVRADSTTLPFGTRPRGYLVYDATGHVFLQVENTANADSLRLRSWRGAPDSVVARILRGFRAYFGTWSIDSSAGMVTHRIEGELLPQTGRVEVATPFRIRGDSLVLGADSLERWYFLRVR